MKIAVLFHRFGPYHHARLKALANVAELTAIELCSVDKTYAWDTVGQSPLFDQITLFADADIEDKSLFDIKTRLWHVLDAQAPDVVAIPGWASAPALIALSWCLQHKIPAVVMSASTELDEVRSGWKEWIKSRVVKLFSAGIGGGAAHIAYLSGLGLDKSRLFVGYDVVDNLYFYQNASRIKNTIERVKNEYRLPHRYFINSSRFIEKKNLFCLLEAYGKYRKQAGESAWHLVILGDGPLRASLESQVITLGLTNWVLLPGFIQYPELPAFYGSADAYIQASTSEQWGLVVNEAMASGLPVLVSNRCGCAPDLVEEGNNGYTFDPYDIDTLAELMSKVASNDDKLEDMGWASVEIIGRWTPDTFAENLLNACKAALQSPRANASLLDKVLLWMVIRR